MIDFKVRAFEALKARVRHVSKPAKQLVVRFGAATHLNAGAGLPDEATLTFSGLVSAVFGLREDDPSLFRKVEEPR